MIDQTDIQILKLLEQNARMQWQEIGELVHLTGQAVKNRVERLEKLGVIEGYSVNLNYEKLGKEVTAYVTIYMKTSDHPGLQKFLREEDMVKEAHRISGEGCYILKVIAANQQELTKFLDRILQFGNYILNLSIQKIN